MMHQRSNSLLNEHWKRKQRLKSSKSVGRKSRPSVCHDDERETLAQHEQMRRFVAGCELRIPLAQNLPNYPNEPEWPGESSSGLEIRDEARDTIEDRDRKSMLLDDTVRLAAAWKLLPKSSDVATITTLANLTNGIIKDDRNNCQNRAGARCLNSKFSTNATTNLLAAETVHQTSAITGEVTGLDGARRVAGTRNGIHSPGSLSKSRQVPRLSEFAFAPIISFTSKATTAIPLAPLLMLLLLVPFTCGGQSMQLQSDPRPTIYSGQVSFGLLLSAHSSLGAELSTSASHQVVSLLRVEPPENYTGSSRPEVAATTQLPATASAAVLSATAENQRATTSANTQQQTTAEPRANASLTDDFFATNFGASTSSEPSAASFVLDPQYRITRDSILEETIERQESRLDSHWAGDGHAIERRQIFERTGQHRRQQQLSGGAAAPLGGQQVSQQQQQLAAAAANMESSGVCSLVNANALYAGMGAIWASHQANLVGDSHLAIGTYVYDSCNDLDVGQRQSVRIVSNLNAFQQTTCESPRGSPISLTIAHGDNQLRAIQLLTSFKVPVITTKEHFDLEDYNQLTRDQKRFLFTTASSSRHLAVGALRFSKRIVTRSVQSPKLPNQFHKMSSKNGLIVISRNLPARFIAYLTEMIPNHVNYEMLQSNQPIDQIRSVEALESILIKGPASESKLVLSKARPPAENGGAGTSAKTPKHPRLKRDNLDESDGASGGSDGNLGSDFDSPTGSEDPDNTKMLSPTILMFITPSEAIDLVTRLRHDLAEVSRYYSLIVTTREDISPALKTIFHRGGSRICSGKAFYTISPKPDDIGEFSRYFRDTVQMEGESSDHPLVCEFAKYQTTSKVSADLDDISTEPVIKAVWSAAAAFKSVHRRECGSLASAMSPSEGPGATAAGGGSSSGSAQQARTMSGRDSGKSAHAECLAKMNKNMSQLVQRALRRLDVTINSTGLQSLDGFRLKFDDLNELMTNKFSIKYINKECEIAEIGQYSGFKESSLRMDEETLVKSLEGSMPEPWPAPAVKPPPQPAQSTLTTSKPTASESSASSKDSGPKDSELSETTGYDSGDNNNQQAAASTTRRSRRKGKRGESPDPEVSTRLPEEEDTTPALAGDSSDAGPGGDAPKRNRKRSKPSASESEKPPSKRKQPEVAKKKQVAAAPVTALGGKNILPGLTDTETSPSDSKGAKIDASASGGSSAATSAQKPMRKLKPFPSQAGTTVKDWLPLGEALTTATTRLDIVQTTTRTPSKGMMQAAMSRQQPSNEDGPLDEMLKALPTTQSPVQSTLPESDGNADLELPAKASRVPKSAGFKLGRALQAAATMNRENSADHLGSPYMNRNLYGQQQATRQPYQLPYRSMDQQPPMNASQAADGDLPILDRNKDYLRDLSVSPVPLAGNSRLPPPIEHDELQLSSGDNQPPLEYQKASRLDASRLRSHMRWIYSSWYALTILGANICGALMTLYVLTFLLMRNCDGSLDRDNQGIRSMHLLAITVVFFGSTLFIVYPTPGLCLLRTSWHNFALVMLFGSLLLQAMQTRSLGSLGLGGRPNRLNQFLTLIFMVGVQVSFELQRWKYESANYMSFVSQYFGNTHLSGDRKFSYDAISANKFNPLNSFHDQVTPIGIQLSEHYQNLVQDYCLQQVDDFLQSQVYLCLIVGLLVMFSASNRRKRLLNSHSSTANHHKLKSTLTSGKLVASQHEANLNLSPSHFQFVSNHSAGSSSSTGNMFVVTIISALAYSMSIVLHIYGQNTISRDLVSSVTMVFIAFTALIGIFLPILLQIHSCDGLMKTTPPPTAASISATTDHQLATGSLARPVLGQSSKLHRADLLHSPTNAFTMFPEFAQTGLRRPASISGDSSSGAGSRRTFADTKESRRNMGATLANVGPSADSLRSMGFYTTDRKPSRDRMAADPASLKLKLNLSAIGEPCSSLVDTDYGPTTDQDHHFHHHHHQQQQQHQSSAREPNASKAGEKRLIMLDVDPCCPRHGVGSWTCKGDH